MTSLFLFIFLLCLTANTAVGNPCGGLLENEKGHFSLPVASDPNKTEPSNSSCLWIIQLHYKANIRFTLDNLNEGSHLNLYHEDQLTACTTSDCTKLNVTHVGSSLKFTGKTLIVILPNASSSVAFSWEVNNEDSSGTETMKNSDYVNSPHGLLEWQQLELEERVTWAINPSAPVSIKWNLDIVTSSNAIDTCACLYFAIFQLTSEGTLSEAMRTCGQSLEGKLEGKSERFVVLIKANTPVEANKITVSWGADETMPSVPTAGLFAATTQGLIALNLETSEAKNLTKEHTSGVAVHQKLKKVYWSEIENNSRIMRSNFDGSAPEVIVQGTGDNIFMLDIDEPTGNVYFGLWQTHQLKFCSSIGENITTLISNNVTIFRYPFGIVVDSENGVMYWGKRLTGEDGIIRANLDGSNVTTISTEFDNLTGITIDQPMNGSIYWGERNGNTIGTIDANGGNRRTLIELEDGALGLSGLQDDAHKIYFCNYLSGTIQSANKSSGG